MWDSGHYSKFQLHLWQSPEITAVCCRYFNWGKRLVSGWINYVLPFFLCFLHMHVDKKTHTHNIGCSAGLHSFALRTVTTQVAASLLCHLQHQHCRVGEGYWSALENMTPKSSSHSGCTNTGFNIATGWTFRGSNSGRGEIFCICPD